MEINSLARKLRKNQTKTENKLWYFLRNRRFLNLKFKRQYPIGPYIVDFCCIEKRLVIELDGGQHTTQILEDITRTEYLEREGCRVFRFWDHDILKNDELVLNQIKVVLENPHPSPLP